MRGRRTRIATGIYRDPHGFAVIISLQGKPKEFRYPLTWDAQRLKSERVKLRATAALRTEIRHAKGDTLSADVESVLKTLQGRTREDAENLFTHWTKAFGDEPRNTLTPLQLRQHAATWTCAASTFNHRRQALITLYKALNGPSGFNPAREIPKQREITGAPKALPYSVIAAVLKRMPETQSRARLKLMAYTGLPQMQIQKLTPEDWHGDQLRVTPRRKGSGVAGRWIPLSVEAKAAMQEFSKLRCWGNFSRSSLWKAWKAYGPKGSNPYSLRHSWITELYRRSNGDVLAVKQLALHSMLSQTERYAAAALADRMQALVVPRKSATKSAGKPSNSLQKTPLAKSGTNASSLRRKTAKGSKSSRK